METALITIGVVVLVIGLLVFAAKRKMKSIGNVTNHEKILVLNDANFVNQIKGKVILVDYWAEWCMPCKMMAPILNELSADLPDGYAVGKLDVDKNQGMAQKYSIRSIPTMILFKNGQEVSRFVGMKTKDFLKKEMMKNG